MPTHEKEFWKLLEDKFNKRLQIITLAPEDNVSNDENLVDETQNTTVAEPCTYRLL